MLRARLRPGSLSGPASEEQTCSGRALVVAGVAGPSPNRARRPGSRRVRVLLSRTRCLGSARRGQPPGFEDGRVATGSDPALARYIFVDRKGNIRNDLKTVHRLTFSGTNL
ncbi:uncharacterized protein LOC128932357 [Callithrix jacchus]|uniref:uncharacterized protein LOC128932357 n=1 Tax=Callithrix jacchus TaxID=9483 RepID=UPI0004F08EA3|nr:uncharacterized protein LOC128932357 [Callithrix jacchus]